METKKIVRITAISLVVLGASFGIYKGAKWGIGYFKAGDTGGKDKVITLADGTTVTVSAEQAKLIDNSDINILKASMQKYVDAGKIKVIDFNEKDLKNKGVTKYEVQQLMYYLDKGDPKKYLLGLSEAEVKKFTALLKTIGSK